ncbi:unnamed protein product [Rangifer tarandus platyrhynchus]|uniref:Uncharacterized protein n=2 Tax=Rangifer tarandus platyrhynchus TaxID=3082113 RepID=A0AC59Z6K6_RANTA|nr:unnamed protein product [Rangifer tarandus platyrhynchus]
MGLVVPQHVGPSQTRNHTSGPCIARRILNHRTPREVPRPCLKLSTMYRLDLGSLSAFRGQADLGWIFGLRHVSSLTLEGSLSGQRPRRLLAGRPAGRTESSESQGHGDTGLYVWKESELLQP